jgi:hypothetical protein
MDPVVIASIQNSNAAASPTQVLAKQSSTELDKKVLSQSSALAVGGVVTSSGSSTKITASDITGINGVASINTTSLKVDNAFSGVSTITNNSVGQLSSAIQSISGTFSKVSSQLATGIDKALGDLFKNTNSKVGSAVNTKISDPVSTNLLTNKTPVSSAFKITGLEEASKAVSMSGISSSFGSKAPEMVSTEISTLLNRFNLDSSNNLGKQISNSSSSKALKGLVSDVSKVTKDISNLTNQFNTAKNTILNSSSTVLKTINNDLQSFVGKTSNLSNLLGINTTQYFTAGVNNTLKDNLGNVIDTRGSGVDRNVANTLLDIARTIGCAPPVDLYDSVNEINSLFATLLATASSLRLDDLVDALLGCNQATTDAGQDSVIYTFNEVAATDPVMADKLLDSISNPALVSTEAIQRDIVTNPNLSINDISSINSITAKLGSSIPDAFSVPGISTPSNKVYNLASIDQSSPSFVDGAFSDQSLTIVTSGKPLELSTEGYLVWT